MEFTKEEKRACYWLILVRWNKKSGEPIKCRWNDFILKRLNQLDVDPGLLAYKLAMVKLAKES